MIHRDKVRWKSRTAGTILSIYITIILSIVRFVPESIGWNWEWTYNITYWWYPIPIWVTLCLIIWVLGLFIKLLFKII